MKSVCTLAQDQYGNYVIQVFPLDLVHDMYSIQRSILFRFSE